MLLHDVIIIYSFQQRLKTHVLTFNSTMSTTFNFQILKGNSRSKIVMVGIGQMLQLFIIEVNHKTWSQFLIDILNQMIKLRSYSLLSHIYYF